MLCLQPPSVPVLQRCWELLAQISRKVCIQLVISGSNWEVTSPGISLPLHCAVLAPSENTLKNQDGNGTMEIICLSQCCVFLKVIIYTINVRSNWCLETNMNWTGKKIFRNIVLINGVQLTDKILLAPRSVSSALSHWCKLTTLDFEPTTEIEKEFVFLICSLGILTQNKPGRKKKSSFISFAQICRSKGIVCVLQKTFLLSISATAGKTVLKDVWQAVCESLLK